MMDRVGWELAGEVGVDGAHILIGDANYAENLSRQWREETHRDYDSVVQRRVAELNFGLAKGFACASGDGDGCYPIFIKRGKSKLGGHEIITQVLIDFTEESHRA